jgi:FkbM family methyltransferase
MNKAVLNRDETVRLYLHENATQDQVHWSTGSSLLDFKCNINRESFIEVEAVDFACFVSELNSDVKVVKMDVEGVECQILHKLIDTGVIERIGLLLVETHDKKIPELREATEALKRRIADESLTNIALDWV